MSIPQAQPRPRWWPPICPVCRAECGLVPSPDGMAQCDACRDHPGHAWSHTEHTKRLQGAAT